MTKKNIAIYLISDSSGETVSAVSEAVVAQFEDVAEITEYIWPLVRSTKQIDEILQEIKKQGGVIFYTIVDHDLRKYLEINCYSMNVICVSLLAQCLSAVARFLEIETPLTGAPGKHKVLDENYYRKIDVINYTVQHDDGQISWDYNDADILLFGVSRTSKSPTALYLAQRGYKTANIPIIKDTPITLNSITKPVKVGLMISADVLEQIRSNRLMSLHSKHHIMQQNDVYMNLSDIQDELRYAKRIFLENNIPIIDVTRKAVEEIAAEIINIYFERHGDHKVVL